MCVCVRECVRNRDGQTEKESHRLIDIDRQREREKERKRDREKERERE